MKTYFALFTDIPDVEMPKWEILCERAAAVIAGKVKPEIDTEKYSGELCAAAAACAYYEYMVMGKSGMSDEIKVGDISLKNSRDSSTAKDAAEIRDYFLGCCAGLLENAGYAFVTAGGADNGN